MRNAAILIFDDVEVLDFCGPFEVFSVTGQRVQGEAPFRVYTVAEQARPVLARNGLSVNPAYTLHDCPPPDILLIPGGRGTRPLMDNTALLDWIRAQSERVELLLSVCTGALLLGKAGLLDGLEATTHHSAVEELRAAAPNTILCPEKRWVDNGKIVLSAGVSAGIDMALYVVSRLLGAEVAAETAHYIQYDYWR
ncbi:MAG: AraC family transcriptional regulator [Chloroflexota bacterium]|nr:MAG: AraC family transcriptional regulator [Chloroflexota bacterium]